MRLLLGLAAVLGFTAQGFTQVGKEKPTLALNVGGHTGRVQFVAFRNDGRELVSYALDRMIRIWDVETGEATKVLRLPALQETDLPPGTGMKGALSPDGKQLAVSSMASSEECWIYLIDLDKDKATRVLKAHTRPIWALAWSPDGRWLASGGVGRQAFLWDLVNNSQKALIGHPSLIRGLAFSPDSQTLASATLDKVVKLWSVATGQVVKDLEHPEIIAAVAWSPDGKTLATRSRTKGASDLFIWNAAGERLRTIKLKGAVSMTFNPVKNTELLMGSQVLDLTVTKGKPRKLVRTFFKDEGDEDEDTIFSGRGKVVAWSKDGLAALGSDDGLVLWNTKDSGVVMEPEQRLQGRGHVIHKVAWGGPSNASVAWSAHHKDTLKKAFDFSTLRLGPADKRASIIVSAVGQAGGLQNLWQAGWVAETMSKANFQVAQHQRGDLSLERGPKGLKIDVKRGNKIVKVLGTPGVNPLHSMTFCGDGQVVIGGQPNCRVYDLKTGKRPDVYPLIDHIWSVAAEPQGRYFVAGGVKQTLSILNPRTGSLLVSLYVAGNDWIAWTPEGYYAASPGGEALMGWQVTTDPEQLAVFYPAEQFRKSLYRPDVIRLLLQEGSLQQALEEADRAANKKSPQVSPEKKSTQVPPNEILPPKVAFLAPTARIVKEATIEVQAAAESTGQHPVTALRLFVNDRPFEGLRGVRAFRTVGKKIETWNVPLVPGVNKLMVIAESSVSKSLPATREVTFLPALPLDPRISLPSLYMLAIGIDQYVQGWQLQCCVNDATKLTETIEEVNKQPKIFGKVETRLVTDQCATRQGILDGLVWLKDNAKAHDVVILFYAGHGDTTDDGDFFLLSSAWAPNKQVGTTVSGKELKERLADLPCRVLLMLDACKSGAAAKAKQRVPPRIDKLSSELTGEVGAVVLFAAGSNELAGEEAKSGHGYFTSALLEGLRGKADLSPKDGFISLNELVTFVEYRVPELSDDNQHPTADKPGNVRSFALAVCAPNPAGNAPNPAGKK